MTAVRLRHLLLERDVRGLVHERVLSVYRDQGVVPKDSRTDNFNKTPPDLRNYKLVEVGDVVVNKMKAWAGSVAVSPHRGIVSGDYLVCSVRGPVLPTFLHHLLRSQPLVSEYRRRSSGVRPQQWRLYWPQFAEIRVNLPSMADQKRIADHLDAEAARIDRIIQAKTKMASLATLRARVAISESVNQLPQPWPTLARNALLIDCKHRTPTYTETGYPIVGPSDVKPGDLDLSRCARFVDRQDWLDLAGGQRLPTAGDVIYSRNASVGIAGLVTDTTEAFCMGQDVCLIRPPFGLAQGRYLTHVLNTVGLDQINEMKIGSTFSRINVAQIGRLRIPMPSASEQVRLVETWDAEVDRAEELVRTLAQQEGLLRERHRSLVTATVTADQEAA